MKIKDIQNQIEYNFSGTAILGQIDQVLKSSPPLINEIMSSLAESKGKNIRGQLTALASCNDSKLVGIPAIKIAAAIELLHLASLIHDDIMDDADTRRGLPSTHSRFGKKNAVISGDYLFCLCFSLISEAYSGNDSGEYVDRISDFSKVMSAICLGEIRQNKHNSDLDLNFKNYLKIIGGKTATLFSLSMYAGARAGGLDHKESKHFGRIGANLGVIFQLIDDYLDYEIGDVAGQKPVGKDIREGIVTLPIIYAIKKDPTLKEFINKSFSDKELLDEAIDRVRSLGGPKYTKEIARKFYDKTSKLINKVDDEFKKAELTRILEILFYRKM
jgi:heptaprenyl diphosphate synthase